MSSVYVSKICTVKVITVQCTLAYLGYCGFEIYSLTKCKSDDAIVSKIWFNNILCLDLSVCANRWLSLVFHKTDKIPLYEE